MVDSPLLFFAGRENISGMGRKRTQLQLAAAQQTELTQLLKIQGDRRTRERLEFLQRATSGRHTLEELAQLIGRSRSTLQNWLGKFTTGGLAGLLERDTPPGRISPLAQRTIQGQMETGLRSGRLKTAAQVAAWLREKHGVKRDRKSIYYWLRRREENAATKHLRPRPARRRPSNRGE
jgi:transposase